MLQLNLKDKTLYYLGTNKYQNSLVSDRWPTNWEWVKDRPDLPTYYTYASLDELGNEEERNLILLESSAIIPHHIEWVQNNAHLFKTIYTHSSSLLSLTNAKWIPGGGVWIGTEWGGGEVKVYDKSKGISFVSSNKTMCHLHVLRLELAQYCKVYHPYVSVFGMGGPHVKPVDYLKDFRYSVVVENNVDECYFTEKLLNCFATGTIPIYLGAKTLPFNPDGILRFYNYQEFPSVLKRATPELYSARAKAIRENFELCQKYLGVEDYMWANYASRIKSEG